MTSTEPARTSTRREEIVAIAKGLIADRGYAGTSTRDIADACGMLPGSLYSHFRSKAQILDLVIGPFYEQLLAEQEAVLAEGGTGIEQLERMIRRVTRLCAEHGPEIRILHYDWPHFARNEELAGLLAQSTRTLALWYRVRHHWYRRRHPARHGRRRGGDPSDHELDLRCARSPALRLAPDVVRQFGLDSLSDEVVDQLTRGMRA